MVLKACAKNTARIKQHGFFVQSLPSFYLLPLQVGRNYSSQETARVMTIKVYDLHMLLTWTKSQEKNNTANEPAPLATHL